MTKITTADAGAKIINSGEGIVASGVDIEGGYFAIDSIANIPSYANVLGTLCYVTGTEENPVNKFYQYNGTEWVEADLGGKELEGLLYKETLDDGTQTVVIENEQSKVKFYHSEEYDEAKLTIDDKKVLTEEDLFGDDVLFILESEGADVQLVTLDKTKLV
jgi:hypothetical protein